MTYDRRPFTATWTRATLDAIDRLTASPARQVEMFAAAVSPARHVQAMAERINRRALDDVLAATRTAYGVGGDSPRPPTG